MQDNERASQRTRWTGFGAFFGLLILVVATLIGVGTWNDSTLNQFGGPSSWQLRLQQAVSIGAILVLFWSALRASRTARWLPVALVIAGGGLYAYRFVVFAVLAASGSGGYATTQGWFPSSALVPLHLLFYFLAMGVWGLLDRSRARNRFESLARIDVPVIGLVVFFMIWFGLRQYALWAGAAGLNWGILWPSAIGFRLVVEPVLLIGAFYFLHALPGAPRRRGLEWLLAGGLLGLAFTLSSSRLSSCGAEWWGDAGVGAAIVGLAAIILPRVRRVQGISASA